MKNITKHNVKMKDKIKDKIKEVQQYFIDKLLSNQFEIVNIGLHVIDLKIDNYQFNIWMANTVKERTHYYAAYNFMDLELNLDQCIVLGTILRKEYIKFLSETMYNAKLKELETIQQALQM